MLAVRLVVQRRSVMPGQTLKTEAVVLRSIRYGEADRILHLYSAQYGRIGAIAKGVRKPRNRASAAGSSRSSASTSSSTKGAASS